MGNRTHLFLGNYCEFEADNCLPVTWLALFAPEEFLIEKYVEETAPEEQFDEPSEKSKGFCKLLSDIGQIFTKSAPQQQKQRQPPQESVAAGYRTSQPKAIQRVESVINRVKGHTPVWAFLRPLEILRDELMFCPENEPLNLDLTQLWAMNDTFNQKVKEVVADFYKMLDKLSGDEGQDLFALSRLVDDFAVGHISSVLDLTLEERMFVLIGTYWGSEERQDLYSLEYFSETYWVAT